MNKVEKYFIRRHKYNMYATALLLCGCMFLFASCEREEDVSSGSNNGPALPTGDPVTVNFTVSEIKYDESEVVIRSGNSPSGKAKSETKVFSLSEDLNMHITLAEKESPVELRALVPLDEHSKVRIVAYTGSSYDTKAGYADYEIDAGRQLIPLGSPLILSALSDCKFVAYSYHDALSLDAFADTTVHIANRDLLWGTTTQTVGSDSVTVHIDMYHKFSRVIMEAELGPGAGSVINDITDARVSTFAPMLEVRTGNLIYDPNPTLMGSELFSFASSGGAVWTSDNLNVYMGAETALIEIFSVDIDGTTYTGPFFADYPGIQLVPGTSYLIYVRFLKSLSGSGAPRITWDAINRRYAITTDPTDAGLYFKFGSVAGIFSGEGTTQTLTQPVPGVSGFVASRDTAWSPVNITSWANVPRSNAGVIIDENYHTAFNIKQGLGDPCRLVGLDLDYIKNNLSPTESIKTLFDNGKWRLPTQTEMDAFAASHSDWMPVSGINGRYFLYPTSVNGDNNYYFYPAAGYRDPSGVVDGQNESTRSGDYWSNKPFDIFNGSGLNFDNTSVYSYAASGSYAIDYGFAVRCIPDPFYHISVELIGYSPQNRYLLNGSTYEMKVFSNTAWNIKNISGITYNTGSGTVSNPSPMLVSPPGGSGTGNVSGGESVYFTVVNDDTIWGSMTVTFASTTAGQFDDYEVTVIFALPTVKILGLSTVDAGAHYGYNVAQPHSSNSRNAYTMLTTPANFGTNPNSTVYCSGFTLIPEVFPAGMISSNDLTLQNLLATHNPDIIVLGFNMYISTAQAAMYKTFMDNGGVLIAIIEDNVHTGLSQQNLMNAVFGVQSPAITCTTNATLNGNGSIYQLTNVDDIILNGPFDDIRGLQWGEDASATGIVNNLPNDPEIVIYSNGNDISTNRTNPGISAFRYRNLIYVGDGGFLSSTQGSYISSNIYCPFMVNNITKAPIPKPNFGRSTRYPVYNSTFFGNMMAWAIMQVGTTYP